MVVEKKCKILKLPTGKDAEVGDVLVKYDGTLVICRTENAKERVNSVSKERYTPYYIYVLSYDEPVKKGDWFDIKNSMSCFPKPIQSTDDSLEDRQDMVQKIIATTDESLRVPNGEPYVADMNAVIHPTKALPRPSQDFIQYYCDKGGIDEVMVEYDEIVNTFGHIQDLTLKVASDNTITIKPVKEIWSREEVEALIYKYIEDNNQGCVFETDEEWIKKNV